MTIREHLIQDLTEEQKQECLARGIDWLNASRVTYRNGKVFAIDGKIIVQEEPESLPFIMDDIPEYQSPVDGTVITSRSKRRDDMKRHGCRPWEGMEQEKKEAERQKLYQEIKYQERLHEDMMRSWYSIHPDKRRLLERYK